MRLELFKIGPFTIDSYGLMIARGVIAAFILGMHRARKRGLDPDQLFNMGLVGVIGGIIGARLLYYITVLPDIIKDPSILWDFSEGFVVYGGLILGILAPLLYTRIKKIPFWQYLEVAIPSIPLAQGFGRIGCFLAGCCYGKGTDCWIGVTFPENSLAVSGTPLIPTQLISSAGDFLIAAFLLFWGRKRRDRGQMTGLYLSLYAIGRFVIEFFRADYRGWVGPLSTSQFISIFMLIAGIGLIVISRKLGPGVIAEANTEEENPETEEK